MENPGNSKNFKEYFVNSVIEKLHDKKQEYAIIYFNWEWNVICLCKFITDDKEKINKFFQTEEGLKVMEFDDSYNFWKYLRFNICEHEYIYFEPLAEANEDHLYDHEEAGFSNFFIKYIKKYDIKITTLLENVDIYDHKPIALVRMDTLLYRLLKSKGKICENNVKVYNLIDR